MFDSELMEKATLLVRKDFTAEKRVPQHVYPEDELVSICLPIFQICNHLFVCFSDFRPLVLAQSTVKIHRNNFVFHLISVTENSVVIPVRRRNVSTLRIYLTPRIL